MSMGIFCAEAPRRAAAALLRALGGSEISLRVATPIGEIDERGLGLQQYETTEIRLAPVVLRQTKSAPEALWEAVAPASEIEAKLGPAEAIAVALRIGTPVLWRERRFRIAGVVCDQFAGRDYLYRITLGE